MKLSILGTGVVGKTIAQKMTALGHDVSMGTRNATETSNRTDINQMTKSSFSDWLKNNSSIRLVNFIDVPDDTDIYVNATGGSASIEALTAVGKDKLAGKTVIDIANPLDFSKGMPPTLSVCNTDSLAEQIQRAFPDSHIVKSLNTMNCYLMMNPAMVPGDHTVFVSGENAEAKKKVKSLLNQIGWKDKNIYDLGGIETARGTEMMLPIWLRLWDVVGSAEFNFHIARK